MPDTITPQHIIDAAAHDIRQNAVTLSDKNKIVKITQNAKKTGAETTHGNVAAFENEVHEISMGKTKEMKSFKDNSIKQ